MEIYCIIPLNRKGELEGGEWFTTDKEVARCAAKEGNNVTVAKVPFWETAFVFMEK